MEAKFVSEDGKIVKMSECVGEDFLGRRVIFGKYDVVIDELGVKISGLDGSQAYYIEKALTTQYGEKLIETLVNNRDFDLTTFIKTMKLEDITAEKPSKILLSAQGMKYHEDVDEPEDIEDSEFRKVSRIVTEEQAQVIKQCVEKNPYYNFKGATDKNHGFDVEKFGLEFISHLDYGLNEYTYEQINKNPQLIEKIKNNPQVALYVASMVNEHIKIKKVIEEKADDRARNDYNYSQMDDYRFASDDEKEILLNAKQEDQKMPIFQRSYNTYEEDIHDLETLYMERMQNLMNMYENENIEMFKTIELDDLDFNIYAYNTDFRKDIIKLETLKEESVIEFLKARGNEFIVEEKEIDDLNSEQAEEKKQLLDYEEEKELVSESTIKHETTFFSKIINRIKGFFNRNKKLPPISNENQANYSANQKEKNDFVEEIKVSKSELLKPDEQEKNSEIDKIKDVKDDDIQR